MLKQYQMSFQDRPCIHLKQCAPAVQCAYIFLIVVVYFLGSSGGVMIYFDRIEVVNYLVPAAGTYMSS